MREPFRPRQNDSQHSRLNSVAITVVRWFLGPLSYSVGTPGGLFAPLLVVGAAVGSLVAVASTTVAPGLALSSTSFAVVGMSTFFAAVVRAPITGVVLIMEMTAQTALVVPMALAGFAIVMQLRTESVAAPLSLGVLAVTAIAYPFLARGRARYENEVSFDSMT